MVNKHVLLYLCLSDYQRYQNYYRKFKNKKNKKLCTSCAVRGIHACSVMGCGNSSFGMLILIDF